MIQLREICAYLEAFAPLQMAEDWDNVGLLVGDPQQTVGRVMTCLTVTPASAAEAVAQSADLIVTHHPLPFRPLKRLTADQTPSRLLLQLIRAGIAVYSPHTAFDSAVEGINQQLATGLGLIDVAPLVVPDATMPERGAGRHGRLSEAMPLSGLVQRLKQFLSIDGLHLVGDSNRIVLRVAVACGAAGEFLGPAADAGCDVLVTGETTFHTCLEAEASEIALLLPGHFASERFAVETLAEWLAGEFPDLTVWASREEKDPLRWV
ncbi:MAG: Nif3-like dinuclear metal center hexameric protein [Pirellulaceae bacterium]|nr:Nif3-like dinuclear metal center hexameric protein [Pirellulaceae bacterium]